MRGKICDALLDKLETPTVQQILVAGNNIGGSTELITETDADLLKQTLEQA